MSNGNLSLSSISPADLAGGSRLDALRRLAGPDAKPTDRAVEQAAKGFESVLLEKLMDSMQETIPDSGLLGDGTSKQVQGMFWSFLAQDMANKGGIGLWKELYRQWTQHGAAAPPATGAAEAGAAPAGPEVQP